MNPSWPVRDVWVTLGRTRLHQLKRRFQQIWLDDHVLFRWCLPMTQLVCVWWLSTHGIWASVSVAELQAQLRALNQHNALQQDQMQNAQAVRQRARTIEASMIAWQNSLRWEEPTPWLHWPEQARALGISLQRIKLDAVQEAEHGTQHVVSMEGVGLLTDLDRFWRDLGQRGWWITPQSMRMAFEGDGTPTWHARWAVHQWGEKTVAQSKNSPDGQGRLFSLEWAQKWLTDAGPSIADAHALVPVVSPVRVEENWSVASLSNPLQSDVVLPSPWPRSSWEDMRLVGRWVRGRQVVALVAVDEVVHAVVPGMRLGPQQLEVVRVTMDGVWVKTREANEPDRRVLHWPAPLSGADL